jgi:hypothetical protein
MPSVSFQTSCLCVSHLPSSRQRIDNRHADVGARLRHDHAEMAQQHTLVAAPMATDVHAGREHREERKLQVGNGNRATVGLRATFVR